MELIILLTLVLGQAVQTLLLWRLGRRWEEDRRARDAETGADDRPDPMDQGFENLMRFSVRGRTGLEREEG